MQIKDIVESNKYKVFCELVFINKNEINLKDVLKLKTMNKF